MYQQNNEQSTEQPNRTRTPFMTIDKILEPSLYQKLHVSTRRFFCGIWNVANWRGQNPCWIDEVLVCEKARIQIQYLDKFRSDLLNAGLLKLIIPGTPDVRDGKSLYELTDPDQFYRDAFPEPEQE
jgi:hypothetical protein